MKNNIVGSSIGLAKFIFAGLVTLLFRLVTPFIVVPFLGPLTNVTPLMATQLAGAKAYGPWISGLYGFLSMFALDAITGQVGSWTVTTSLCYGIVGIVGGYFLANRRANIWNFLGVSIAGTLFFDLITGILVAPLYGKPMLVAAVGQIPFTIKHLIGNVIFAGFAPWFYREIMANFRLEIRFGFKSA